MYVFKELHVTNSNGTDTRLNQWSTKTLPVWMRAVSLFFSAIAAGALIGWAWRDESWGWGGVGGIALFLWAQSQIKHLKWLAGHAYLTGTVSFAIACPWISGTVGYLAETSPAVSQWIAIGFQSFQSIGLLLFSLSWRLLRRNDHADWMMAPFLWVGWEQLVPTLFPWPPAVMLTSDLPMLQVAEFGGVHLVSLLVLAWATMQAWIANAGCMYLLHGRWNQVALWTWTLVLIGLLSIRYLGTVRSDELDRVITQSTLPSLRVGLVQADTQFVDSNQRMIEVTREMQGRIDLAIWPESSLGNYSRELTDFSDPAEVHRLSHGDNMRFTPFPNPPCLLLAGADTWDSDREDLTPTQHFVSAVLMDRNERLVGRCEKVRLMPYGEYIPGEEYLPWLRQLIGSERRINRGNAAKPIGEVNGFTLGVLLCCEDMHSDYVREVAASGVDILVTLGNGMAFDAELPLRQHFRISLLRAIEHRRYFVRCTSTGVSGLISPTGRVLIELPARVDSAAVLSVPQVSQQIGTTLFTRHGWLWSWYLPVLVILFCLRWHSRSKVIAEDRAPRVFVSSATPN